MRFVLTGLLAVALLAAPLGDRPGFGAAGGPRYVSLGDSLAASVQPDTTGRDQATTHGFSEAVWEARKAVTPELQLVKLGRGGETAASMIHSAGSGPSQLDEAEAQVRDGSVSFVTIDIGANEVEGCADGDGFDQGCVDRGLASLRTNLPKIIRGLRAAAKARLTIVGVNYYNSFLGRWVTGPDGRRLAMASVPVENAINTTLAKIYGRFHVPVADVETKFQTDSLDRYVRSRYGRVPLAVAQTCRWTWACSARYDDHTNTRGYHVIARAVLSVLRQS